MKSTFKKADILVPTNIDISKWSVVACDQYTSDPLYWEETKKIVGKNPSSLNIILPEVYLDDNVDKSIKKINKTMESYLKKEIFQEYNDSLIYIEREQSDGRIREGIIGEIDLEDYSFENNSKTRVRATEETVIERIPPRVKVREHAPLEMPHIMILINDPKKEIIESIKYGAHEKIYDFDLMQNGGHIKGYKVPEELEDILLEKINNNDNELVFAVGDGNHSLATAKICYEKLKEKLSAEDYLKHPARYALVEIVNLHSDALQFKPIHRVLFDIDVDNFIKELNNYYNITEEGTGQKITIVTNNYSKDYYIENPKSNISVGSIQMFLDEYLKTHEGIIDYIHGEDAVKDLVNNDNTIGILLDSIKKEELFDTVIKDGVLPRKAFSMGHSYDKRFYLEARKIK